LDPRLAEMEIERLDRVRQSAEEAAAAYARALTAAAKRRSSTAPPGGSLRASRAELLRRHGELSLRLDRVASLAFPTPCEAAPLAFAFAAAGQTLAALDRLSRAKTGVKPRRAAFQDA
jgi:hypothetical protein